ncbi:MAG: HAMP domain-containing sensor histidine kinase [Myxococcales bacterium]
MQDQRFLEELKSYVGFNDEHARALAEVGPAMEPCFPDVVERFYDAIQQNPRAMEVFTGGAPQIERQKNFLRAWLVGLFSGVYDLEYLQLRARIGRTHVRIRLDQRYMFTAMNLVREGLHLGLEAAQCSNKQLAHAAIDKICDIELAIMLQTYSEDYATRLRDNERLVALGQLAGFIGHELRNPLAVMETSLHLLKKRLPETDENVLRHLGKLSEHLTISSSIIAALLELARDRPVERVPVQLATMLTAVTETLPGMDTVQLSIEIAPGLPEAKLDDKQMRHLVGNLVTNAIQELDGLPPEAPRRVVIRARRDKDVLLLSVDDSGKGIPEAIRHRLFEPLATTKAKGLGLGLALCRRIAEKHQGHIRAVRSPLGGASFEVYLPGSFSEGA